MHTHTHAHSVHTRIRTMRMHMCIRIQTCTRHICNDRHETRESLPLLLMLMKRMMMMLLVMMVMVMLLLLRIMVMMMKKMMLLLSHYPQTCPSVQLPNGKWPRQRTTSRFSTAALSRGLGLFGRRRKEKVRQWIVYLYACMHGHTYTHTYHIHIHIIIYKIQCALGLDGRNMCDVAFMYLRPHPGNHRVVFFILKRMAFSPWSNECHYCTSRCLTHVIPPWIECICPSLRLMGCCILL